MFVRMASYANMTTDAHPQKRVTAPNPSRFGAEIKNLAAYLATVNSQRHAGMDLRVQDAAAHQGPRQPRDRHRIFPAARADPAA